MPLMFPDAIFVDEAIANLDAIEQGLAGAGPAGAADAIHALFRHAHSVKGGAAAFGLDGLAELMHLVESLLDVSRATGALPDAAEAGLLREAVQAARQMLLHDGANPQPQVRDLMDRLRKRMTGPPPHPAGRLCRIVVQTNEADVVIAQVVGMFGDIAGLGELLSVDRQVGSEPVFVVRTRASDAELLDLLAMHVERHHVAIEPVSSRSGTLEAAASDGPLKPADAGESVRVDAQKLKRLVAMARALARDGADATAMGANGRSQRWLSDVRVLCDGLESLGSAPVSSLFDHVPAVLQRLSAQLGKSFELNVTGEDIRVDRRVLQALVFPLLHLVRNACDHGIEAAQLRRAAGKPKSGRIVLAAWREAGMFRISVRDDGAGLSRDKLLHAARARAIAVPADVQDQDIWALVFAPGLSTSDRVGEVSGRGVGMDAVKTRVEALDGQVAIASAPGNGVCVTISIPLDDTALLAGSE